MATVEKTFADKSKTEYEIARTKNHLKLYRGAAGDNVAELNTINTIEHELVKREKGVANSNSSRTHFVNYAHAKVLTIHTYACYQMCEIAKGIEELGGDVRATLEARLAQLRPEFAVIPNPDTLDWTKYMATSNAVSHLHADASNERYRAVNEKRQKLVAAFEKYVPHELPTREQLAGFMVIVERHDYFYSYSDDITVYRRGNAEHNAILEEIKKHPIFQDAWEAYSANADGKNGEKYASAMAAIRTRCAI